MGFHNGCDFQVHSKISIQTESTISKPLPFSKQNCDISFTEALPLAALNPEVRILVATRQNKSPLVLRLKMKILIQIIQIRI